MEVAGCRWTRDGSNRLRSSDPKEEGDAMRLIPFNLLWREEEDQDDIKMDIILLC